MLKVSHEEAKKRITDLEKELKKAEAVKGQEDNLKRRTFLKVTINRYRETIGLGPLYTW